MSTKRLPSAILRLKCKYAPKPRASLRPTAASHFPIAISIGQIRAIFGWQIIQIFAIAMFALIYGPVHAQNNPEPTEKPVIALTATPGSQPALQLEARQAPLGGILKQFAEKTGAIIHYSVLPEEPVTATCAGDTVKTVMECLLGNKVDRVYRKLNPQDTTITPGINAGIPKEEVWILGARYGDSSNMSCTLDAGNTVSADNEADALPQQALMNMAQIISDPRYAVIGKQALSMLAAQGKTGDAKTDAKIVETLEGALKDKSPEARAQAVFGLS
jgi:hypothetical protein